MSSPSVLIAPDSQAIPITAVTADALAAFAQADARIGGWIASTGFKADSGTTLLVPDTSGALAHVVLGLGKGDDPWSTGGLAKSLPKGRYRIAETHGASDAFATWAALAWALGAYQFTRYKKDGAAAAEIGRAHV